MSSDDSDAVPQKRKRKLGRLKDSPSGSSTSGGSPVIGSSSRFKRKSAKPVTYINSSDDSDSDNSIIHNKIKRKKALILCSDSDDSSSGSDIVAKKKTARIHSESDNGFSSNDSEWESCPDSEQNKLEAATQVPAKMKSGSDTDSSVDTEAEKCPICLLRFKLQPIGTPETCDHMFCLECLQEWSKNMNTCPVDRMEYTLILVRDNIESTVTRRIEIEKPKPQDDTSIVEDPTFCEICGSSENEDRLLLCDGCDLGFHLYCLTPPLDSVPAGAWYCNECSPDEPVETEIELLELQMLIDNADESLASLEDIFQQQDRRRRNRSTRLVPRTQQTERVRRSIVRNRNQRNIMEPLDLERPSTSSGFDDSQSNSYNLVSSTSSSRRRSLPKKTREKSKKRTKKKKSSKSETTKPYRIVYEIDKHTGEAVPVKMPVKSYKPKRSKRRHRRRYAKPAATPKTTKGRLASQLGICASRNAVPQELPGMRVQSSTRGLNDLRHQAGIPALRIFDQNHQLDYLSGSDDESYEYGSSSLLTRRAPNRSDVVALRRAARRKAVINVPNTVSSTTDILGSILDTQEKFHSRNTIFSVDTSSGKLKMDKKNTEGVRQRPAGGNNPSQSYKAPQGAVDYSSDYQYQSQSSYYNFCSGYDDMSSTTGNSFGRREQPDMPQDYTRRTLCEAELMQDLENKQEERTNSNTPVSESDLDIYSDIESEAVTTTRMDEPGAGNDFFRDLRPPSPPQISSRTPVTDEDNDSESGMVIDTEKAIEENKEETAVTSTVGTALEVLDSGMLNSSRNAMELQSGAIQSSSKLEEQENEDFEDDACPNASIYARQNMNVTRNDEEDFSDDECPNFSIYSKESKNVAMTTDIGYQVQEPVHESVSDSRREDGDLLYSPFQENFTDTRQDDGDLPYSPVHENFTDIRQEDGDLPYSPFDAESPPPIDLNSEPISEVHSEFGESANAPEPAEDACIPEPGEILHDGESGVRVNHSELGENVDHSEPGENVDHSEPVENVPQTKTIENFVPAISRIFINKVSNESLGALGLYSDSEDESVVKKTSIIGEKSFSKKEAVSKKPALDESVDKTTNAFAISDIKDMTEDILSEEERSYTPCLDERMEKSREGLDGLDTELISDEDRNDFDESHELKTASDGDALEINAKESELDFTRPEDYEEGEIVDKNKDKCNAKQTDEPPEKDKEKKEKEKDKDKDKDKKDKEVKSKKKKDKTKEKPIPENEKGGNKENENKEKEPSFKKLSKSNKERNYRDKERDKTRSKTPEKLTEKEKESKRKKEKRKELERYNVRALIAEKPRPPPKDKFGRDLRRTPSRSKTRSRSYTPPIVPHSPPPIVTRRSLSNTRRSLSRPPRSISRPPRSISRPPRSLSRTQRSISRPRRSLSRIHKSPSKERVKHAKKRGRSRSRHRTASRSRTPIRKRSKSKTRKRKRSISRGEKRKKSKERTKSKKRARSTSRRRSKSGTPARRRRAVRDWTPSFSRSPTPELHRISPSWTPPRAADNSQALRNQNLTVILNNESGKKKKEKRRKGEKRKEGTQQKKRRRERERTPPPSKEVFASGDNILVSVSFNNENETRDVTTRDRRKKDGEKEKRREKKRNRQRNDLSGIKPVAIIDLERSPFQELPPSPKDIIVLSDSDNNDNENTRNTQKSVCDSSQQVASPERITSYTTGPKTPPEPQVKFSLNVKPPQMRAISNPLHEPDDHNDEEEMMQEEIDLNTSGSMHKGPNTPPEPPNSPPSSPDAYDPFEPTKSRSPTPLPSIPVSQSSVVEDKLDDILEIRSVVIDVQKVTQSPEVIKSLTPPVAEIQPADSQSSMQVTPDSNLCKSPEQRIGVVVNQQIIQASSMAATKPVAQTTPFSSVPTSMVTSTPVSTNLAPPRISILSSTLITPPHLSSSVPQRIVLPNQVKSSPVKISPTKAAVKSTPIKPMQSKNIKIIKKRAQNVINLDSSDNVDLDSPYSPGSSDYEDLFEPPTESIPKSSKVSKNTGKVAPQKPQSAFDVLFGSPVFGKKKHDKSKPMFGKKSLTPTKTKQVGVKVDEDSLKILEDLPNSAVEMQVKDKFLKKLNRQERVVEEVKMVLKPYYNKKKITKEEYKDIMRRAVPKICHNKSGEINPTKIKHLVEAYVKKIKHSKKVTSSSSIPQKGVM